jgi:hypothetical protein
MIALKACPRCRGDMFLERLVGDAELLCLQCGYRTDFEATPLGLTARAARKAA